MYDLSELLDLFDVSVVSDVSYNPDPSVAPDMVVCQMLQVSGTSGVYAASDILGCGCVPGV